MAIAHELRNALGGIRAAVDVFGARLSGSDRDQAVKRELTSRVASLEHFIADLLMLSRPMESSLAPHALPPVIRRAVESLHSDGHLSGVTTLLPGRA